MKAFLPAQAATGIVKKIEVWDFRDEMHLPIEERKGKCVETIGPIRNIITNYGLNRWATFAFTGDFPVCVAGTGTTRDTRYPSFTLAPGTNIGARSGNTVTITGTTDTTLFNAGDTLQYQDPALGEFVILTRIVNGSDIQLTVKNADGSDATGTSPSASPFFIWRTSEAELETEIARAGTPAGIGASPAAQSEGTGFIGGDTDGPVVQGTGGIVAVTSVSGGLSTGFTVIAPGSNYVNYSPPRLVARGGGAGQMIPGLVTSTPSDNGVISDPGSGYSNTPGEVILRVLGAGVPVDFPCTVSGGLITGVTIDAAREGYFSDIYTTDGAKPTLQVIDSSGTGSGASIQLFPRRAPEGKVVISSGQISQVVQTYPGYELTADAITVTLFNTGYFVDEQTNVFAIELSTKVYTELGFSHTGTPGANLFNRLIIRNPSTGAIQAVTVLAGQQLRVTFQAIRSFSPATATVLPSAKVGQWNASGRIQYERFGISSINGDGTRGTFDEGLLLNEPSNYLLSQVTALTGLVPNPLIQNQVRVILSDSSAAHLPWGAQVVRDDGEWSDRPISAPVVRYVNNDQNLYPVTTERTAFFSVLAGNNVTTVGSVILGLVQTVNTIKSIYAIGISVVMDAATLAQPVINGRPGKTDQKTFEGTFVSKISRTLSL